VANPIDQAAADLTQSGERARCAAGFARVAPRRLARVLAAFALSCLSVMGGGEALAQSTATAPQLNENRIERIQPYRSAQTRRYWISYDDCVANDVITFPIGLTDNSRALEVWVGNDNCAERRGSENEGQCWLVARIDSPTVPQTDVPVSVRAVVQRDLNATAPPTDVPASVCENNTDPNGEKLTYYFILEEGGKSAASDVWTNGDDGTGYDLVGPRPPGNIRVGVGESQLAINIDGVVEEADRERFEAFCVPAGTGVASPLDAGGIDAGLGGAPGVGSAGLDAAGADAAGADAAGADAAGASDASSAGPVLVDALDASSGGLDASAGAAPAACFTPLLRQGERPPNAFSCGTANETARTLRTGSLQNGQAYAIGVSGQDLLGNAGELSEIRCGTPVVLDDFFELYSRRGGVGGGGFCSLSASPGGPHPRSLAGLGLLVTALLWRRARSRA
jgi:hypothetical protein